MPERRGRGYSLKLLIGVFLLLSSLLLVGFIGGALGSSFLGLEVPSFLKVSRPHVELPGEEVFHLAIFPITNTLIASILSTVVLASLTYAATRKMKLIPTRLQCLVETVIEMLLNFVESVPGKEHGRRFFPIIATIFLYVITNAYLALLPFFTTIGITSSHGVFVPLFRSANTDINLPLSIAIVSFIFVEYWGMRALGVFHYIGEFINLRQLREGFLQLLRGKLRAAFSGIVFGVINLFVGTLEIFSHFIRLISFTFRLFGNMTAGEILLLVVCFLIPWIATIPFYGLELLIGFIQALIFAGLTLVFATVAVAPHAEESQ